MRSSMRACDLPASFDRSRCSCTKKGSQLRPFTLLSAIQSSPGVSQASCLQLLPAATRQPRSGELQLDFRRVSLLDSPRSVHAGGTLLPLTGTGVDGSSPDFQHGFIAMLGFLQPRSVDPCPRSPTRRFRIPPDEQREGLESSTLAKLLAPYVYGVTWRPVAPLCTISKRSLDRCWRHPTLRRVNRV